MMELLTFFFISQHVLLERFNTVQYQYQYPILVSVSVHLFFLQYRRTCCGGSSLGRKHLDLKKKKKKTGGKETGRAVETRRFPFCCAALNKANQKEAKRGY